MLDSDEKVAEYWIRTVNEIVHGGGCRVEERKETGGGELSNRIHPITPWEYPALAVQSELNRLGQQPRWPATAFEFAYVGPPLALNNSDDH